MVEIEITDHFKERFAERQAKTKRISIFVNRAYYYGAGLDDLKKSRYTRQLSERIERYGGYPKIYHGFIYWFIGRSAITIYQIPRGMREVL